MEHGLIVVAERSEVVPTVERHTFESGHLAYTVDGGETYQTWAELARGHGLWGMDMEWVTEE